MLVGVRVDWSSARWAFVVALLAISAACTDSEQDDADRDDEPDAVEGPWDPEAALPGSFEIVRVTETQQHGPDGAVEQDFVAAVGPTREDPRFLELALFEFDKPADFADAADFVGRAEGVASQALPTAGIDFAFVPDGAAPDMSRRESLQLPAGGPFPHSTFRGDVGRRVFAVGSARILQPRDVDVLVPILATAAWPDDRRLPQEMRVLVEEPLPGGAVVELASELGEVRIEVREEVPLGWFEYLSWDDPREDPPAALASPDAMVSITPVSNFGIGGISLEPEVVRIWTDDERLLILSHPELPAAMVAALRGAFETASVEELLALAEEAPEWDEVAAEADRLPASAPPSVETLAELQDFVETMRGVELDAPLQYQFVTSPPSENAAGAFVGPRLWSVLDVLGLVEPSQTRRGANEARVEQIKGVPGTVLIQETEEFTETIVVHEMTHTVDEQVLEGVTSTASVELFSPSVAAVEGNAHRVAAAYVASLGEDAEGAVPPFPAIFPNGGDPRLSLASRNALEFAYDEGRTFAEAIAADGGERAIDESLQRPPTSTEQILFPKAYLAGDEPITVSTPEPPEGALIVDEGVLGSYLLLLAVEGDGSSSVDGRAAVDGWAGDAYVLYETDRDVCIDATIEMDTSEAADRLASALAQPGRTAIAVGPTVTLSDCD